MIKLAAALIGSCALSANALGQQAIDLYPAGIPNSIEAPNAEALRDPKDAHSFYQDVSLPQLYPYALSDARGARAAIVILPGGSYRGVSIVKEGFDVAKQLNAYGIAAFVLKYRTPSDQHMRDKAIGPLQDAQQALRLVRERAREWNVDPQRIGLMGFSAGGHLAASAATRFHEPVLIGVAPGQVRPDFLMLAYPVISFGDSITHAASRAMLLGPTPSPEQIERHSTELHVTSRTPQTFIMHAADDKSVVVANSVRFFEALQAQRVPSQLMIYPAGGHGFGLNNSTTPDRWVERARDWLLSRGYLKPEENDGAMGGSTR